MTRRTTYNHPPPPLEHADPRHFYTTDHGHNQTQIKTILKEIREIRDNIGYISSKDSYLGVF
jgi:hypothetical protein